MHPMILAIRQRDKDLRAKGQQAGLWSVDEAGAVLGCGTTVMYAAVEQSRIECTKITSRGRGFGMTRPRIRLTSNGLIAFIEHNTSGPDEELTCGNLQAVMRTLSLEALASLKTYIEERMVILSNGGAMMPRPKRSLNAALNPEPVNPLQPELFETAKTTLKPEHAKA